MIDTKPIISRYFRGLRGLFMVKVKIELGDTAKDIVTNFKGVVVCETQWLHGCRRLGIQPVELKPDGSIHDTSSFDEDQLELVSKGTVPIGKRETGGPRPEPQRF